MIVTVGKSVNRVTMPTMKAPIVAPSSGIRSRIAMITASASGAGTPRICRTMKATMPAIVACASAPPT